MEQKLCQSCGMPLTDSSVFASEKDGSVNEDYCRHCYVDGAFANPDQTMQEMIEISVPFMKQHGMSEQAARDQMNALLPNLKRWK